jgi:hypothetical protein
LFLYQIMSSIIEYPQYSTLFATLFTALGAIISILTAKHFEIKHKILYDIRKKKIPVYNKWMDFFFDLMFKEKFGEVPLTEQEMAKFFSDFTKQIIIWGSDDFLKLFYEYKKLLQSPEYSGKLEDTFLLTEKILYAIRVDLGHKNKNLQEGDILTLFITDAETLLQKRNRPV